MALTDAKIKAAKLEGGKKVQKFADSGGLYLLINKSGKYWRLKYRYGGKEKSLSIGVYPQTTLKQARDARQTAKEQIKAGVDPSQAKQSEKRKQHQDSQATTFKSVAYEWIEKQAPSWATSTHKSTVARLERHIIPFIGSLPIKDIEAIDVLSVARCVEEKGNIELAHRIKRMCGQVLRYAVVTCLIKSDPSRDIQGALSPVVTKHRACPNKQGNLCEQSKGLQAHISQQAPCAYRLMCFYDPRATHP